MPTAAIHIWGGKKLEPYLYPERAHTIAVKLEVSKNWVRGQVLAEKTDTPGTYDVYADGGSNGLNTAKGFLAFDCVTDSAGLITITDTDGQAGGEWGQKVLSVPMYVEGYFKTTELTGLDANGLADLNGNMISGAVADGIVRIG